MDKLSKDRFHYLLLKIHSLTGIVPIGAFLVFHMAINSLRTVGAWQYQLSIDFINNLPFLLGIEIFFIFIPLLIHSFLGFYITFTGKPNVFRYRYTRNWMYFLQRLSGAIVFVFLVYHIGTTVGPKMLSSKTGFEAAPFLIDILNAEFKTWSGRILYMIGIIAAAYHFGNGLWGFCMSWGIIIGRTAQRNASILFTLVGLGLILLGFATVLEFSLDPVPVTATEGG